MGKKLSVLLCDELELILSMIVSEHKKRDKEKTEQRKSPFIAS